MLLLEVQNIYLKAATLCNLQVSRLSCGAELKMGSNVELPLLKCCPRIHDGVLICMGSGATDAANSLGYFRELLLLLKLQGL